MYKAATSVENERTTSSPQNYFIRTGSAKFRKWLLAKVDVNWGKKFTHNAQDTNGVTAFFEDGSSARGDVFVGVDGIASRGMSSCRTQKVSEYLLTSLVRTQLPDEMGHHSTSAPSRQHESSSALKL